MSIQKLPRSVSAAIVSTSSVQSQISVLKELIENAIDAITEQNTIEKLNNKSSKTNAQIHIEIDNESSGLDFLLVKDTGTGVSKTDRKLMCLNCTTSKLKSVDELSNGVSTCGFRGEALNFIARLSTTLSISTKTKDDLMVDTWSVNNSGLQQSNVKSSPGTIGTTVKVTGLFKSTPVRYKFLKEKRHKMLKDIEDLVITFALVYRNIRFQLKYVKLAPNGRVFNYESKTYSNKESRIQFLYEILEIKDKNWMFQSNFESEITGIAHASFCVKVSTLLPKMQLKYNTKRGMKILTVNNRPLNLQLSFGKSILYQVNDVYRSLGLLVPSVWYIGLEIPSNKIDFNIEPEKSNIIVSNEEKFFQLFKENLLKVVQKEHYPDQLPEEQANVGTNSNEISNFQLTNESSKTNKTELFFTTEPSDDESFIDQLDSSLSKLQKQYDLIHMNEENELTQNQHKIKSIPFKDSCPESSIIKDNLIKNQSFEADQTLTDTNNNYLAETSSDNRSNASNSSGTVLHKDIDNEVIPICIFSEFEGKQKINNKNNFQNDHDSSKTMYHTTDISSKTGIAEQQGSEQLEPEDLTGNHMTISDPCSNPVFPNEIEECANDTDLTLVDSSLKPSKQNMVSYFSSDNNLEPIQKKQKMGPKTTKQMALSSFSTYHISTPIQNEKQIHKQNPNGKLTKISGSSQNTINDRLDVFFEYTLEKKFRDTQIIADEEWVNRSGIPSTGIINGVLGLYEQVSHPTKNEIPSLNELEIYRFV